MGKSVVGRRPELGLQSLGQRGLQSLNGGVAVRRRGVAESGQGRLRAVESLNKGALSGADLGHGIGDVDTLLLQGGDGPLQFGVAMTGGVGAGGGP